MANWKWLADGLNTYTWRFVARVIIKAALLFVLLNVLYALLEPLPFIGQWTLHNILLPGRERLPYGENPAAYNLSINNIETMFATHEIRQSKASDEYRVILIGDSATWGILLPPDVTLAGQINAAEYTLADGRRVRAYNLGHPTLSLTKDLLLLDEAMQYQPDAIIWLTTLQSFNRSRQLDAPLVQQNATRVRGLITQYDLLQDANDLRLNESDFMERTLIGQRRELADWLRLQFYGVMWAVTGIDQVYPEDYDLRANDFEADASWLNYDTEQALTDEDLAFDVISAGLRRAGDVPVLLVNEPIFIADGENSDLRYNFWYPRWAYDAYRQVFEQQASENDWHYVDMWDAIAPDEFTDSPVHLTAEGTRTLTQMVGSALLELDD